MAEHGPQNVEIKQSSIIVPFIFVEIYKQMSFNYSNYYTIKYRYFYSKTGS